MDRRNFMDTNKDIKETELFLKKTFKYKDPEEYFLIWTLENKRSYWCKTIDQALSMAMDLDKNQNIYLGGGLATKKYVHNLENKEYSRCTKENISSMVGLWLDIDVQAPHRGKDNLPKTKEEAIELIDNLPLKPTHIIDTGYGYQVWYLFKEPWQFEDEEERKKAEKLSKLWNMTAYAYAAKRGWAIDKTFNLDRLMRLPGTKNNKGDTPLPVKIVEINDLRYSPDDFEQFLIDPEEYNIKFNSGSEEKTIGEFNLELNPEASPPKDKFKRLMRDEHAKNSWNHNRDDIKDNSPSGYDLSLANIAARKNWKAQEICDLLIACRRNNKCDLKLRQDYYDRTIKKALKSVKQQKSKDDNNEEDIYTLEDFLPRQIAKLVSNYEKDHNRIWEYDVEQEVMYRYNEKKGVWRKENIRYLENSIREVLSLINPKWVKINKVREVKEEFKNLHIDFTHRDKFNVGVNPNKSLINIENGMLDWQNMTLKEHNKEYYSQFQLPVDYSEDSRCPKWRKTLKEWLPDQKTRDFIQEFIGLCLIPDTKYHKALILHGAGSNGKSTFLEVIAKLLGEDNLSNIPMHRLSNRFETAYIQDKLVNICSDIDPKYLNETGVLKTMIAGEPLRGEHKFGSSFDFTPVIRLIFSANEIPKARDKTDGWYRRLEIVDFPNHFSKDDPGFDPYLKEKLYNELGGIFLWALKGLKRLEKQGCFTRSDPMKQAMADYMDENDSVKAFVRDRTVMGPSKQIYGKIFYEEYKAFCSENGIKNHVTRRKFTTSLKKEGIKVGHRSWKGSNSRFYIGIDLNQEVKARYDSRYDL
jgi:putative DNA primase/helicase